MNSKIPFAENCYPVIIIVRAKCLSTNFSFHKCRLLPPIPRLLKHSRHTKRDSPIPFHAFPHDADLCPVATINQYITAQATLANNELHDKLLCYRKPHGPTTKDTLARWVRSILTLSGVNMDTFTAHSCRSASASKAMPSEVALDVILKAGQWSADSTFYTFYRKDIIQSGNLVDILPQGYYTIWEPCGHCVCRQFT